MLSILLYGAKTWVINALILRRLKVFHSNCVRRDVIASDLHGAGIDHDWYHLCQDRKEWAELCKQQIKVILQGQYFIQPAGNHMLQNCACPVRFPQHTEQHHEIHSSSYDANLTLQ